MDTSSPISGKLAGPVTLLKRTIASYKKNSQEIIKLTSIQFALVFVLTVVGIFMNILLDGQQGSIGLLALPIALLIIPLVILSILAQVFTTIALIQRFRDSDNNIPFAGILSAAKAAASLFWPYVWTVILGVVIIIPLFVVFFWILGIPGLIFSVFFSFVLYTLVIDEQRGLRAFTASWYYVQNNWWKVFGRFLFSMLVMIGITLVYCVMAFLVYVLTNHGLGTIADLKAFSEGFSLPLEILQLVASIVNTFVIIPCSMIYLYEIYKDLKASKAPYSAEVEGKKQTWTKVLAIIGAIVVPLMIIGLPITVMLLSLDKARNNAKNGSIQQSFLKTYDNNVISFNYPGSWTASSTVEGLLLQSPLGAQVFMSKFDFPANHTAAPLNELADKFTSSLKKEYKGDTQFEIYATADDVIVGGQKSIRVLYGHSSEIAKGPRLLSEMVLVPHANSMFTIELTDTEAGMQFSEDMLLGILESVNFK